MKNSQISILLLRYMKKECINPNKQQVDSFFSWYIDGLEKHTDWAKVSILPLMAWNNKKNSKKMSFFSLVKLAYYQTVGYTSKHGK